MILDHNFHVVALSETWLNERISSNKFTVPSYNSLLRLDRAGRVGVGVAFIIHNTLAVKRRKDLEISGMELLWIEFRKGNIIFYVVFVIVLLTRIMFL